MTLLATGQRDIGTSATGTLDTTTTLDGLRRRLHDYAWYAPEYVDKMMHKIPRAPIVDRVSWITEHAKGRTVLNVGCASGALQSQLEAVATRVYGIDREDCPLPFFVKFDLEECAFRPLPPLAGIELVVVGELLEHLSNPGHFLDRLRAYACDVLLTVPSAYGSGGIALIAKGIENVSRDHVAWYSYMTLTTLLRRHGYQLREWAWYCYATNPRQAEGLAVVVTP